MTHDINDLRMQSLQPLQTLLDDYTTTNVTYVGKAPYGTETSSALWQIFKMDETTGLTVKYADDGKFSQVWDNRVSLTYT